MKTHMLKMHGIHMEASGGSAQIGGVQCDICHKELCSKYFLKVHKQNTHGIADPADITAMIAAAAAAVAAGEQQQGGGGGGVMEGGVGVVGGADG